MNHTPLVVVHSDPEQLAQAVAGRLVPAIVDDQWSRGAASVVLTGGGIGIASIAQIASARVRDSVDWNLVNLWWGDERFVAASDPDRNDRAARQAVLDQLDLDPRRVHPMGSTDQFGDDIERAAAAYAAELDEAARAEGSSGVPEFSVVMLGIGEDGHVASLFPQSPAMYDERTVVAVHASPKPPPRRLSLTLAAINSARQVWVIAAGRSKAAAVRMALEGTGPVQVPAAGVQGIERTLFLLDREAASQLPSNLARLASP